MNNNFRFIFLLIIIIFTLNSCNTVNSSLSSSKQSFDSIQQNKTTVQNSKITSKDNLKINYSLYNEIINSVDDYKNKYPIGMYNDGSLKPIGYSSYLGYQLYDIDGNGIKELFIFRLIKYNPNSSFQEEEKYTVGFYRKLYIEDAYTIDNQVVKKIQLPDKFIGTFNSFEITSNCLYNQGSNEELFYALKDGRLLLCEYVHNRLIRCAVLDFKNKIYDTYYAYYFPNEETDWEKNDMKVSSFSAETEINELLSQTGLFNDMSLTYDLINSDYETIVDSSVNNILDTTDNITLKEDNVNKVQILNGWVGDSYYENGKLVKNKWEEYYGDWYFIGLDGVILKNQWIQGKYIGSDGKMYVGKQTPDGQYVGNDGNIVNTGVDLYNSIMVKAVEPDSWYKTQSGLWYYFENDRTTTKKGWFKDKRDNQTYYLDTITGIMQVGWHQIDNEYYYFNESHANELNWYETNNGFFDSYGKKVKAYGSMFKSEKTPDGYWVNHKGMYIENGNILKAMNPLILVSALLIILILILVFYNSVIKKNNNINYE